MATCLRCGNEWTPRKEHPKKCPGCQNPNWDKPRTRHRRVVVVKHEASKERDPVPAQAEGGSGSAVAAEESGLDRIKQLREQAEKFLEGLL